MSKGTSQVGATQARHAREERQLDLTAEGKMCSGQQDVLQTAWAVPHGTGISQEILHVGDNWRNRSNVSGSDLLAVMSAQADDAYA